MIAVSRRDIYRRSKRLLVKLLLSRWEGSRRSLERCIRHYLRGRRRHYLLRLLRSRAAAWSAAALILVAGAAHGDPLVQLTEVANGTGGFVINGSGNLGTSVSGGTDISGDGLADVVVGAPSAVYNAQTVGKVYVVFGRTSTSAFDAADLDNELGGGFVIRGDDDSQPIGARVGSAGFINNGGFPEVVLSKQEYTTGGPTTTYVVHGRAATGAIDLPDVLNFSAFEITGTLATYEAPPVYAFGDVNGDGRDDVVIGARYENASAGRVYVVFGTNNTAEITAASIASGNGGFVINGQSAGNNAGETVSIVPDMNGDGRDEIVVGAPFAGGGQGTAYVVFGKTTGTAVNLAATFSGGFSINGGYSGEYAGRQVAGCEDINGDGLGDVLMGAPFNDSSNDGNAYVIFGKSTTTAVNIQNVAAGIGGFVINGRALSANAGISVSSAGDVNGDGLEDVILGSFRLGFPGQAYVVFGKTNTDPVSLEDVWSGIGGFGILGTQAYDYAGQTVSRAGDVNGDGGDDVVVGSRGTNRAYVVFGSKPAPVSVGLTNAGNGEPLSSGVVFIERTDAPVGFRAPLAGLIGGEAIYQSSFADIGDFNVVAIASGFQASDPVLVSNDGTTPGIALNRDVGLVEPNILTVIIRVLNQQGQPTGQRVLTKEASLFKNETPVGITPLYGQGAMIFVGAPSGELDIVIPETEPDTKQFDFLPKTVNLGTGVQETVIVDAVQVDGEPVPRALPGIIVGSVMNGSSDPIDVYAHPLVIHTVTSNGLATSTTGTVDGAYVFADAVAGAGTVQAFSGDGTIEGSTKNVTIVSGQIYGDQTNEDTLLSVSPPSGDSDFDGLPDSFESAFLNTVPEGLRGADDDPDLDGLTNLEEFVASTHPANFDSDSDGEPDGVELVLGTDPNNAASTPGLQSTVYVDFGHTEAIKAGLLLHPFSTLEAALEAVETGGTIQIKGDVAITSGARPDAPLSVPMTLRSINGTIRIE